MFMRIVQIKVNPDMAEGFKKLYEDKVIPALQGLPGCYLATLMRSEDQGEEYLSMSLWDSRKHAESYEQGGVFRQLLDEAQPFLGDSSEWKIQLTDDFQLDYSPQQEEPVVTSFPVVEQSSADPSKARGSKLMFMRVVSIRTKHGKTEEFKKLYREIIIPALDSVEGCRYAYLTESMQEPDHLFSITIWDSKQAAENYESGGLFDKLTDQVQHTFTELFHWKMSLERDPDKQVVTSDDLRVDHYSVVTGRNFE